MSVVIHIAGLEWFANSTNYQRASLMKKRFEDAFKEANEDWNDFKGGNITRRLVPHLDMYVFSWNKECVKPTF